MKKIIKIFVLLIFTLLLTTCGDKSEKNHEPSETKQTEEHEHGSELTVKLNDGKLWKANPETTTGINNMIRIMDSFSDKETVDAYAKLNDSLKAEFSSILTKCTMDGAAHDQLHNYLVQMKDLFDSLGSSDLNTCKASFDKLKKHLTEYSNYFE